MFPTYPDDIKTWHDGNCQCGAIRFRALIPPLTKKEDTEESADRHTVSICNCSICNRNGLLVVYPLRDQVKIRLGGSPDAEEVTLGSEKLREKDSGVGYYQFGGYVVEHVFCLTCGSSLFIDAAKLGIDMVGVNVSDFSSLVVFTLDHFLRNLVKLEEKGEC